MFWNKGKSDSKNEKLSFEAILAKKRQWFTEKSLSPLPVLHENPSTTKLALSRISIVATIFFWLAYVFSIVFRQLVEGPQTYHFTMEAYNYSIVVSLLTLSSLIYLITRHGALQRFSKHTRVPRILIDNYFAKNQPSITVLVPSYNEEYSVIRKTLLSAALQEYPDVKIVLLVDNNPNPKNQSDIDRLNAARNVGRDIEGLLAQPYEHFSKALQRFKNLKKLSKPMRIKEILTLAQTYDQAAKWLKNQEDKEDLIDHVDVFFREQIFGKLADDLSLVSSALKQSVGEPEEISDERIEHLYQRLTWIFKAKVEVFERKKYLSLSHEANKAMNLNSYIGLMGGRYRQTKTAQGIILTPDKNSKSKDDLIVPDSDFLLTLDADSLLLREYCLRLVYLLQQPDNAKVAVTQTPYSSFRGALARIERLAGATTDIQHILHQGMTHYGATFWVGANAVIRKIALEDIVEKEWMGGIEIKRYIQDRTVIEDTESTVDLTSHGWKLINYPERLSYSATPPDFGSLIVQRRRWANGGLLIFAKLWPQIQKRVGASPMTKVEFLIRLNYLVSIAWATFGLIFLLAFPYDGRLLSPLVLLAALPYFLAMASDLKYSGYNYIDVFRIYGFNLIMLPINLAGVAKSIEQAFTGKKIPFARTPKIQNRTASEPIFVLAPLFIVAFSLFTVWRNVVLENWANAFFAGFNATVAIWAIIEYIGFRNIVIDCWVGFLDFIYVEPKNSKNTQPLKQDDESFDWKHVLNNGEFKSLSL